MAHFARFRRCPIVPPSLTTACGPRSVRGSVKGKGPGSTAASASCPQSAPFGRGIADPIAIPIAPSHHPDHRATTTVVPNKAKERPIGGLSLRARRDEALHSLSQLSECSACELHKTSRVVSFEPATVSLPMSGHSWAGRISRNLVSSRCESPLKRPFPGSRPSGSPGGWSVGFDLYPTQDNAGPTSIHI
ncbi:hypothetical protein BKA56DRAFT_615047 [Ilyonectria sp. MPI-CAGE-AT-0026]|nr:hypothetical protein BKA56DRAFT_615047 [Ilyonectria sp. MPI-CAGE-AT-0026]